MPSWDFRRFAAVAGVVEAAVIPFSILFPLLVFTKTGTGLASQSPRGYPLLSRLLMLPNWLQSDVRSPFVLGTERKTPLLGRGAVILSSPFLGVPFPSLTLQVRLFFFPVPLAVDCAVPCEGDCSPPLFPCCCFPKPWVCVLISSEKRSGSKEARFRVAEVVLVVVSLPKR